MAQQEQASGALCAIVASPHGAERLWGFAVFDEERRRFQICEYVEDSHASRTEALLLQVQPRCLCAAIPSAEDMRKLGRVAESCGVTLTEAKASDIKQFDAEQDLSRLLVNAGTCGLGRHQEEMRRQHGMRSLAALIGHNALLSEPSYHGACTLVLYPLTSFLYLDKAAFAALNVLPRPEESLRASTSLLGLLNRCRSPVGTRRLRQWLTQPLTSAEEISKRHDVVEAFCSAEGLLRQVEGLLRRVPDLERLASKLQRIPTKASKMAKAGLEDLVTLYHCILSAEQMVAALQTYAGPHADSLAANLTQKLSACIMDFKNFRNLVEQTIDLQQAEQRTYCISSRFDASLVQLAQVRDGVKEEMEQVRRQVEAELGLPGNAKAAEGKAVTLTDCPDGQALRVAKKNQQAVQHFRGSPKLKVLQIKKLECIFTTPAMDGLNRKYKESAEAHDRQSAQLAGKALAVAATYSSVVERLAAVLGGLDVLAAFARVTLTAPCSMVRAKLDTSGGSFNVEGAFHLLVVANSDQSFVANDIHMSKESSWLHLITGPNMGGKSTYIRSLALIALLNQIGCFVPCSSATLPVFDAIMCRVGASDMQLRGISTFMAEMLEASCILNAASERSLVIIDELGRGTSTSDGFGIAWAIAKHLVEKTRCYGLFATHFHEMAELENATPDGAADQSYGAHVAELAGFPKHVVEAARKKAVQLEAEQCGDRSAKRARIANGQEGACEEDPLNYIMSAADADDFVRRAIDKVPQLRVSVGGSEAVTA